jgi:UDP-2,3-diacylglucosamine pyrophosphatase LpxH
VRDCAAGVGRVARPGALDGVVCGHIHHAEMRIIDGTLYANDGDWVESLTALVEHADGRLEIVDWSRWAEPTPAAAAPAREREPVPAAL